MVKISSLGILTKEAVISKFIPYSHHVTQNIIATKNADYLSVWRLGGRSHQSAAEEDIYAWIRELNNLLRGICSDNISLWSHVIRRRVYEYPDSNFGNSFCSVLDEKYKSSFADYNLMVNDLYLTIVYRPTSDNILSFFAKREKENSSQKQERQNSSIKILDDINQMIDSALRRYNPELLGIYDKNNHAYSKALEFLAYLINGEHVPIPICRSRFADYMNFNRILFSKWGEVGEIRSIKEERYFGMLEIADYDESTEPGQLNALLESDYELVISQSFSALSRYAAKGFLQKHKQQLIDAKDVAYLQIEEIDEALNQLISGKFVMGEHHASVLVHGNSPLIVKKNLAKTNAALLDVAIVPKICDLALEAAFFAQLPGNWEYRPRPMPITSLNFLCLSPFHNFMSGKPVGNPWGPAVTILKTVSSTPLYFNFHASPLEDNSYDKRLLGNTMFIGKSGTGKTVTIGFLIAQAQKYNPTIVVFDKDRGMDVAIRAMGGRYLPLKKGISSGFNPFGLEPTPENLSFLKQLIKKLITSNGEPYRHNDEEEIDKALNTLMFYIDKPLRRLSMLVQGLPNPINSSEGEGQKGTEQIPSVHARLKKWCTGEELGWVFDNETDALNLTTHSLYGFDVTEFIEDAEIRVPIIMYLIFRTESMIDGRRFMYVFDEFWKMLGDPYFEDLAKNKQKTIRKENGIFIFLTQEPSDALESSIAKTLVQQCATFVFLPNPSADKDDYIEGFKLSEAEFDLIKNLSEDSRRFLIKQGDASAVAELNLKDFDSELLVLSGTPDNAELVENIIKELGNEEPDIWLPIFYKQKKIEQQKNERK